MNKNIPTLFLAPASLALLLLSGCGGSSDDASSSGFEPYDNTAEVDAYYAEHADFFRFKTPEDLPAKLSWENGQDLPEFASPEAKKGGTRRGRLQDFPRTLRTIGPDANGGFRPFLLDDNAMGFAQRHPNITDVRQGGFYFFPGIAEQWALDYDNQQVFVKIHPNASWSDGEPITTEDITFSFYFHQAPHHKSLWYNDWYGFGTNYTHVTVYDDKTFAIGLAEKRPNMLNLVLGLNPQPRHFFREYGPDFVERYQWRFVPTSGPYVVNDEDIRKGRSITLTRLADWWAKDLNFWRYRHNYDRVRLDVIRETPKAFESFLRGELDAFGMTIPEYHYEKLPDDHPRVEKGYIQKTTFFNDVPRPSYGLWVNRSKSLLENRDVRVGINFATNWELICEQYFRSDAIRMNTTADGYGDFTHPTLKARPFDTQKAIEAFAKAGFNERGSDGILVNAQGQRLSFEITTGYEPLKDILTILKEEAAKAGLEFRLEVLDSTAAWKKVQEKNHEISFSAFGVGAEMYPRYKETYHSERAYENAWLEDGSPNPDRKVKTQSNNLMIIAIPELDKLIEAYDDSESVDEMIQLARQMEEIIYEDASFVPGFVIPFIRSATWRWIVYPEEFATKLVGGGTNYGLSWIDEDKKNETLDAVKKGEPTFEPSVRIIDTYAPAALKE